MSSDNGVEKEKNQKYLAYFIPSDEIIESLKSIGGIRIPNSGLHCTICFFQMNRENEDALVAELSNVQLSPFEVYPSGTDEYDDNSFVLKFTRPEKLLKLHKDIVAVVREYADPSFEQTEAQYYGDRYNPHMTISEGSVEIPEELELSDIASPIAQFSLSTKTGEGWVVVKTFEAKSSE